MPLQTSWLDHLFAKLTVRYGAAFMRQWPDADPALIKADWAEVLDGVSGAALSYALRYLPNAAPNAMQFRDLCRLGPAPAAPALPAPTTPPDPQRVQAAVRSMRATKQAMRETSPAQQCIANIERIVAERGGRMSEPQRHMVAHCLRMPCTSTTLPVQRAGALPQPEGAEA